MNYPKYVIQAVAEDFERKRSIREQERLSRLYHVYAICPDIFEIDKELSNVGSEIVKATLQGKEGIRERIETIKKRNIYLQHKRALLLSDLGYDKDYTEPKFECKKCNDTGYVGVKLCSCYKNALIMKAYENSGFGNLLKIQSFENFNFNLYSTEEAIEVKKYYDTLYTYSVNFPKDKSSFLFFGGTGLGKTHLTTAIAKKIIDNGYNVVYETSQNIFSDFEYDRYIDRNEKDSPKSLRYFECDLLIIDDLGAELSTAFTNSCLYNLINTRLSKGRPIITSTNLSSKEMRKIYEDRITSRLFGEFTIIPFVGTDYRRKKLKNN